jgi:FkbM family methyltransferase
MCERLAAESVQRRRRRRLHATPAKDLPAACIETMELLELLHFARVRTIYDIGANVGTWCLLAKSIIPDASVHAFEPLPAHHGPFKVNTASVNNVYLYGIALGPENGTADLHVTVFTDSSSLLPAGALSESIFGTKEKEQIPVSVWRLDDFRGQHSLPFAELIKLDVQGYELRVLEGAAECLSYAKGVIAEVSFVELYERQNLFHEVAEYLARFGLLVRAFGINTNLGKSLVQTDVLFARVDVP